MKNLFFLFAFIATIMFGASTLVSCSKDDNGGDSDMATYTFDQHIETSNAGVAANEAFKKVNAEMNNMKPVFLNHVLAVTTWETLSNPDAKKEYQGIVDAVAKTFNDPTMVYSLTMYKDKSVFNSLKVITTYK